MKTIGWICLTLGIMGLLGALIGPSSSIGPLFWTSLGAFLIHHSEVKENDAKNSEQQNKYITHQYKNTLTLEQKECAFCFIMLFVRFNENNEKVSSIIEDNLEYFGLETSLQSVENCFRRHGDIDVIMNGVKNINDIKTKEYTLLSSYELAKMSKREEAENLLFLMAEEIGFSADYVYHLLKEKHDRIL